MADLRKHSSTSNVIRFTLKNSTTGDGLTGLTSASTGLIISTIADNEATATAYTVAGSTIETITTLGTFAAPTATKCRFKEVDATNHQGLYEFQFADARFSVASAKRLVVSVSGATSLLDADYEIQLVAFDPYDSVRAGLTALPNAAANAAGGLPISTAGALDLDAKLANTNEITAARLSELDAGTAGKMANQVDIIQTDTTTDIPTLIATAQADLDIITGADGATVSTASISAQTTSNWSDTLLAYIDGMAGKRLRLIGELISTEITVNDAAATTTSFITDQVGTANLSDLPLKFNDGVTNQGQSRVVTTHNTTTGEMTFDEPWSAAPANGATGILGYHTHSLTSILAAIEASSVLALEATSQSIATQIGTAGAGLTDLGGMSAAMKAQVNAEVLDVLQTDTFAELAAIPGATSSLKDKLTFVFMLARNQIEQTNATATLRGDDTTTAVGTAAVSDDLTTAIRGEWV